MEVSTEKWKIMVNSTTNTSAYITMNNEKLEEMTGFKYRAKIVEIGLTRVGVFCVDYGESMRQYATQIAQLPSKFTLLTPQAKKYQLAFVKLPDETDPLFHEAHFAFETAIRNRQLLLNVEHCIGDVESVSLSDPDSRYDVAKGLIIARHGREKGFIDVLTEYYNEQKVAKYSKIWAEESKEVKEAYESDNNQVTYHKVVITKVDTDLKFIAQTVENGSLLKKLMEHLRIEMMTNPPLPGAYTPKTGDMCAAPFSEFNMSFSGPIQYNQWCRAKIKEIKGSFVELLFVDYGVSGEIPANEIARLDSKFTQLSPQAQKYKLAFVRPPDDDSAKFDADRAFKNSILHHQFLLNVENCIGDVEMVSLCDLDSKNNVAKSLITAGLVLCEPGREQCFVSVLSEYHKAQEVEKKIRCTDSAKESRHGIHQFVLSHLHATEETLSLV
ncbi:staphylococcal nuclease domain-containing protein 1-like [Dreissena polymorpha]|uniref:staphylococcal nuclease domain-containing protein 1-like n=1 Tax=Dreissena polymorpha TaxID=45954 RepID=UPI002264F0F8|nr:staphylococcal nuclease domain-containing protein 1-like [Dreissena polymorpha]